VPLPSPLCASSGIPLLLVCEFVPVKRVQHHTAGLASHMIGLKPTLLKRSMHPLHRPLHSSMKRSLTVLHLRSSSHTGLIMSFGWRGNRPGPACTATRHGASQG
jgi:hypothetical protein